MDLTSYATHSPFSDPGPHAALLAAVPPDTQSLHTAVTRTVRHYRDDQIPPTAEQLADIDNRWISVICTAAVDRSPGPLTEPRQPADQVGGCCRDHTLLAVAILRQHGIAARSRVGFAGYISPGFHHDHVVAERWLPAEERWVRFDPEFGTGDLDIDIHDLPRDANAPFQTAAQAWLAYRAGQTDLSTYGVAPALPHLRGPGFVQRYLLLDLAHRMATELLLWDVWGPGVDDATGTTIPGDLLASWDLNLDLVEATDHLAQSIVKADDGDPGAEDDLTALWATQAQMRPGPDVLTVSPSGRAGTTDLSARRTRWHETPDSRWTSTAIAPGSPRMPPLWQRPH